jgi:hypothetical protein
MTVPAYAWGVLVVVGTALLLAAGAAAAERLFVPGLRGAPRALARVAVVLCWIFAVCYMLGAVGAFRPLSLLAALNGGPLALIVLTTPAQGRFRGEAEAAEAVGSDPSPTIAADNPGGAAGEHDPPRRRRLDERWLLGALAVAGSALVVGAWLPATAHAYRYGILEPDSTWYHGHFVGRFVQTGWLTRINPVGTDAIVQFHPANGEVLGALLVLPWRRDLALPLVNLAWLGLLLLAGWCVGARWGRGPAALLVTALLAAPASILLSQPGSLKNDLMATALLLASLALLLHSDRRVGRVALAGATLGLALGTRTNLLAPVGLLLVLGAVALTVPARAEAPDADGAPGLHAGSRPDPRQPGPARWVLPLVWVGSAALFGAYWYVRNWVRVGSPLPWLDVHLGPLRLDRVGPESTVYDSSILHWRHHPELLSGAVRPGVRLAFGDLWWAWAALGLVSIGLAASRRRLWWWGMVVAGCVGFVAYLATPLTLVVEPGSPIAAGNLAVNTRYALPALGLILLAGACATSSRRAELAFAVATLVLIAGAVRPTLLSRGVNHDGEIGDAPLALALAALIVAGCGLALLVWPRLACQPPATRLAVVLAPAIVAAAAWFPVADRFLADRYRTPVASYAAELWPAAQDVRDARIGIATAAVPYPYLGVDFSNHVEYVGLKSGRGLLRNVESCAEWIDRLARAHLTHVALAPDLLVGLSVQTVRDWTLGIPGARVLDAEHDATLIQLPARVDRRLANGCTAS